MRSITIHRHSWHMREFFEKVKEALDLLGVLLVMTSVAAVAIALFLHWVKSFGMNYPNLF